MYCKIDELMKERGVTPYKVSKETGIHQASFSDWKHGRCNPKLDKLKILARYFNVSIDYFM